MRIFWVKLFVFFFALAAVSCKKYEEGPVISLRSKKARVVNKWKIEKVTENGRDVTDDYKNNTIEFKEDGKFIATESIGGGLSVSAEGKWEFNSDKTKIIVTLDNDKTEAEILRLKENSLWLKEVKTYGTTTVTTETHLVPA